MQRTDADGNVNGLFSDGNSEQGQLATVIDAKWLNNVQEEIAGFIESAGLELDDDDDNQLYDALLAIFLAGFRAGTINFVGQGGAQSNVSNDGFRVQSNGVDYRLNVSDGLWLNGAKIIPSSDGTNVYLKVTHLLEMLGNAIVRGTFRVDGNSSFYSGANFLSGSFIFSVLSNLIVHSAEIHDGSETHDGTETHNGTENHNGSSIFVDARQTFDNAVSRGDDGRYVVPASVFGTGHKVVLIEMVNDITFIAPSSRQIVDIKDVPATMGRRILVVNHALHDGEYNTIVVSNDNTIVSILSPGTKVWLIANGSSWSVDNYAL